jgi:hypothetical protein
MSRQSVFDLLLRIGERLGVPALVIGVLLWLARDFGTAVNTTVVEPVVKSHVEFLEATRETLSEIGKSQTAQTEAMKQIAENQRELKVIVTSRKGE